MSASISSGLAFDLSGQATNSAWHAVVLVQQDLNSSRRTSYGLSCLLLTVPSGSLPRYSFLLSTLPTDAPSSVAGSVPILYFWHQTVTNRGVAWLVKCGFWLATGFIRFNYNWIKGFMTTNVYNRHIRQKHLNHYKVQPNTPRAHYLETLPSLSVGWIDVGEIECGSKSFEWSNLWSG
jgi:hypothetical protein